MLEFSIATIHNCKREIANFIYVFMSSKDCSRKLILLCSTLIRYTHTHSLLPVATLVRLFSIGPASLAARRSVELEKGRGERTECRAGTVYCSQLEAWSILSITRKFKTAPLEHLFSFRKGYPGHVPLSPQRQSSGCQDPVDVSKPRNEAEGYVHNCSSPHSQQQPGS